MKNIAKRYKTYLKKQESLSKELESIRAECKHSNSSQCGWENDSDGYSKCEVTVWAKWACPDCGKRWSEEAYKTEGPI